MTAPGESPNVIIQMVNGTMTDYKMDRVLISQVTNWGQLPAGSIITKTEVLFPRLEEAK